MPRLAKIDYAELPHKIEIYGNEQDDFVTKPLTLKIGDPAAALEKSEKKLKGQIRIGGRTISTLKGILP